MRGKLVARLSDFETDYAQYFLDMPLPTYESTPWIEPGPLPDSRIAIISTAGIHRRSDPEFEAGAGDYRLIPGDVEPADLIMSHVSVNFDRSGFQQDINVVFPLERLRELSEAGEINSVAAWHYAFMGATDPTAMEESAREVAKLLVRDEVSAALLVPV
jgi:D-proline reductase (dithiol) PrdB